MKTRHVLVIGLVFGLWLVNAGLCAPAPGSLKLPAIFSDNMVVQRDKPVPVWGWADAGASVTVAFAGQQKTATADAAGKWLVRLDPMPASSEPRTMTISSIGDQQSKIANVLVGDVWLCAGQSNMAMQLRDGKVLTTNCDEEIAKPVNPLLRYYISPEPRSRRTRTWMVSEPKTRANCSAVAYYFARELSERLGVPVGVIVSAKGATAIESWMSEEKLLGIDGHYAEVVPKMREKVEEPQAGPAGPGSTSQIARSRGPRELPAHYYNGMIRPLQPFALRGFVWYQGENNAARAISYKRLLAAMIGEWRAGFGDETLPFYLCQLPGFGGRPGSKPGSSTWAELRDAQTQVLELPNTGMANLIDIGDAKMIHPPNKIDVGRRLALIALANAYGDKGISCYGPTFDSMTIRGREAVIRFKHADGLEARAAAGEASRVQGFSICGADRKWVWAEARIEGNTVVVSSERVTAPEAVRYAWVDAPVCNLYNKAGLPAYPFRTDNYPYERGITLYGAAYLSKLERITS